VEQFENCWHFRWQWLKKRLPFPFKALVIKGNLNGSRGRARTISFQATRFNQAQQSQRVAAHNAQRVDFQ